VLAKLYQPYMDVVYGICLKYLADRESAKDAVLGIFEDLIPKIKKHEVENFKGWLCTVARNYCLMQLRSTKNLKLTELKTESMQLIESVHLNGIMENEEHLHQLDECLKTLSPEQKTIVELFYLKQKCYKEIAVVMNMDWNKVRSHIQNGRRNLKICMDEKIRTNKE